VKASRAARREPMQLQNDLDALAHGECFAGVVRVDLGDEIQLERAYGLADRRHGIPNSSATQFAIASGSKGLTALVIASLIEDGVLEFATKARFLLGADLPLIPDDVTVEHLMSHRSGIGDYLDEDAGYNVTDYVLTKPVHQLATTEQYVAVLDGHEPRFPAGVRFAYCNGGFVVLALIAERATGVAFHQLVRERVCVPAGMHDSAFLRSDELPGGTAVGYLYGGDALRTNVFHLPVRGSGDGGMYSTTADVVALWRALFAGRIVSAAMVSGLVRPRSLVPGSSLRYGLGFWLAKSGAGVILEGSDAGVSFRTVHDPTIGLTHTVISNISNGAWPIARLLVDRLS
jgi:CubicO group peptidase (beta-lactamase class C family)